MIYPSPYYPMASYRLFLFQNFFLNAWALLVLQYLTLPPKKFSEIIPNGFEVASVVSVTNVNETHYGQQLWKYSACRRAVLLVLFLFRANALFLSDTEYSNHLTFLVKTDDKKC